MPIYSGGGGGGTPFNGGTITNPLTILPDVGEKGLVITGSEGNTRKLLDLSALHTIFTLDSDGTFNYSGDDGIDFNVRDTGNSHAQISVINTTTNAEAFLSDFPALVVEGASGVYFNASSESVLLGLNAAPADGVLGAGQCALWFDKTNGAAKFMLKGKTTDGTVVAASVAMT